MCADIEKRISELDYRLCRIEGQLNMLVNALVRENELARGEMDKFTSGFGYSHVEKIKKGDL